MLFADLYWNLTTVMTVILIYTPFVRQITITNQNRKLFHENKHIDFSSGLFLSSFPMQVPSIVTVIVIVLFPIPHQTISWYISPDSASGKKFLVQCSLNITVTLDSQANTSKHVQCISTTYLFICSFLPLFLYLYKQI